MRTKIEKGWIVTQNPGRELIRGDIIVENGRIVEIGASIDRSSADEVIDASGCAIIPGLINLHTHIAMTLMRGIADDMHLHDFLDRTFAVDARRTRDDIRIGAELGAAEMLKGGTTSFLDMYYFEDEIAKAVDASGIRGFLGWAVLDEEFTTQKGSPLQNAADFIASHKKKERIYPLVANQGVYVCNEETLVKSRELAERENTLWHMHISETRLEVYEHEKKTGNRTANAPGKRAGEGPGNHTANGPGKRPAHWLDEIGYLGPGFVAAHGVWLTVNEINVLAGSGSKLAHCPVSNMKLATGGVAPLPEMFAAGMTVGLGTDGCSSNNSLDMFGEMKQCALLHKAHRWDATVLPAQKVLDMATIDGAISLGMANELGSIETGKLADLVIINLKTPNMTPTCESNLVSNIVYSCRADNVRDVMVSGELLVRGGCLTKLDEIGLMKRSQEAHERLVYAD